MVGRRGLRTGVGARCRTAAAAALAAVLVAGCGADGPGPAGTARPASSPAEPSAVSTSPTPTPTPTAPDPQPTPTPSRTAEPTRTPVPTSSAPTSTAPPARLVLRAPGERRLPAGPFEVVARHTGGLPVRLEAASGPCRVTGRRRVEPAGAGRCTLRASSTDGLARTAAVVLRKGEPSVGWALSTQTPHSGVLRDPGIRTTSDGAVTAASTTPQTCALVDGLLQASAGGWTSSRSLGTCSVTVTVAETDRWEAARVALRTQVVEAPIKVEVQPPPPEVAARGEELDVTLVLVHPDRSVDRGIAASATGCFDNIGPLEFAERRATIRVKIPDRGLATCTVTVRAAVAGNIEVLGSDEWSWTIEIKG